MSLLRALPAPGLVYSAPPSSSAVDLRRSRSPAGRFRAWTRADPAAGCFQGKDAGGGSKEVPQLFRCLMAFRVLHEVLRSFLGHYFIRRFGASISLKVRARRHSAHGLGPSAARSPPPSLAPCGGDGRGPCPCPCRRRGGACGRRRRPPRRASASRGRGHLRSAMGRSGRLPRMESAL